MEHGHAKSSHPNVCWFYVKVFAAMVVGFYYFSAKLAYWLIQQQFAIRK